MAVSKNPILVLEPYSDESSWNDLMIALGTIIKKRFKTGYVKCRAENMGWRKASGYKVFKCNTDREEDYVGADFLSKFTPDCEWSAKVYSLDSRGLFFTVTHHDNPVNGDRYYLTPISARTYERLS